ncbi:phosphatidylglycerophosphatase A [Terriglobus albidus]|uniref:Phosphatidylglycerophosphatase A n=1 Tax=Terriglobus albidus TaxID=1592106 RepID=A0A5B9EAJ8_9BACT|nr:phosphatidylglycerophosphatase A [Terriglobus albidus]QEE28694.1 phosphatidylglycerophosphatase A [Terriglobus albidus]
MTISTPTNPRKTAWAWVVGTFFGSGLLKPGPGTYGSVLAVLIWRLLAFFLDLTRPQLALLTLVLAILATVIGIPAATRVARESGSKDPQMVVIDEAAGQWVALLFAAPIWKHYVLALVLFRLFDILKPPPVRQLEHLPEGTGIMADDLMAGVYAVICFVLIAHFAFPNF